MVVADQGLATDVGLQVLRDGGNAVDAAVATAFTLAVVLPSAGNIGGGGFMVAHVAGQSYALDFRETAPARASRDMYLDAKGETGDRSVTGALAAGVPGSVAGLWAAHEKLGSRPWASLVAPAITLAEEGWDVDAYASMVIAAEADRLARFPASAALYLPGGKPLAAGTRLRNPDLARTLRRIADKGRDGFYTGETTALLVAEMARGKGIITAADLGELSAQVAHPRDVSVSRPRRRVDAAALVRRSDARDDRRAALQVPTWRAWVGTARKPCI